jgi:hypothetical protein
MDEDGDVNEHVQAKAQSIFFPAPGKARVNGGAILSGEGRRDWNKTRNTTSPTPQQT